MEPPRAAVKSVETGHRRLYAAQTWCGGGGGGGRDLPVRLPRPAHLCAALRATWGRSRVWRSSARRTCGGGVPSDGVVDQVRGMCRSLPASNRLGAADGADCRSAVCEVGTVSSPSSDARHANVSSGGAYCRRRLNDSPVADRRQVRVLGVAPTASVRSCSRRELVLSGTGLCRRS